MFAGGLFFFTDLLFRFVIGNFGNFYSDEKNEMREKF